MINKLLEMVEYLKYTLEDILAALDKRKGNKKGPLDAVHRYKAMLMDVEKNLIALGKDEDIAEISALIAYVACVRREIKTAVFFNSDKPTREQVVDQISSCTNRVISAIEYMADDLANRIDEGAELFEEDDEDDNG